MSLKGIKMYLTAKEKKQIKNEIIERLKKIETIRKLIIFGSFLNADNPNDIDIAVIDDNKQDYLSLALAYRKKIRSLAKKIPIDIFPINEVSNKNSFFIEEINKGEVIYERRN